MSETIEYQFKYVLGSYVRPRPLTAKRIKEALTPVYSRSFCLEDIDNLVNNLTEAEFKVNPQKSQKQVSFSSGGSEYRMELPLKHPTITGTRLEGLVFKDDNNGKIVLKNITVSSQPYYHAMVTAEVTYRTPLDKISTETKRIIQALDQVYCSCK